MTKGFVTLDNGKQVHYRRVGNGPPLIMLHASPQCSEALLPAAGYFSSLCTCLAIDTPGYGFSDDLGIKDPTIGDYADVLTQAIRQMGFDQFYLYGVATGSQIAIEIGKRYPDQVKFLMLDSNGHVSDEARDEILDGYFPATTPIRGGGHLMTYWEMCRSLFVAFPWTSGKIENAFAMSLPAPEIIHSALMRYLRAGEDYALAYRTAFHIEKRNHLDGLDVPTVMTRWEGSLVVSIADDLINLGLPDCVRVLRAGSGLDSRYNIQVEALREAIASYNLPAASEVSEQPISNNGFQHKYFDANGSQIHAKVAPSQTGKPLVCLHDALQSARQFEAFAQQFIGKRPIYLFDLPCHGLSDHTEFDIGKVADTISEVLTANDVENFDIVGVGLGGAVAAGISRRSTIHHAHIVDPVNFSKDEQDAYLENGILDLAPQKDGVHLLKAWTLVRDKELYHPWYDARGSSRIGRDADLSPSSLHDKTVDLLCTGPSYGEIEKAYIAINWHEIYDGLSTSHTVSKSLSEISF